MNIIEFFRKGGPMMWPLLGLSILSVGTIMERLWFWANLLTKEKEIVNRVLEAVRRDWDEAAEIAKRAKQQPIGRFFHTALRLGEPDPELFKLALETAADEELTDMRRGEKILEAVVALSPLLGLLGTVVGLMAALGAFSSGDVSRSSTGVALGIAEALIATATGLVVAIFSLGFYRLFQGFLFNQAKIFRKSGNELELLYRQHWAEMHNQSIANGNPVPRLPEAKS